MKVRNHRVDVQHATKPNKVAYFQKATVVPPGSCVNEQVLIRNNGYQKSDFFRFLTVLFVEGAYIRPIDADRVQEVALLDFFLYP